MRDVSAARVLDRPRYTTRRYVRHTQAQTPLTVTAPADESSVGSSVEVMMFAKLDLSRCDHSRAISFEKFSRAREPRGSCPELHEAPSGCASLGEIHCCANLRARWFPRVDVRLKPLAALRCSPSARNHPEGAGLEALGN